MTTTSLAITAADPAGNAAATVFCRHRCHLGEGPAYTVVSDTAWWFDIVEKRLFEAKFNTGDVTIHALPLMASALAQADEGRQVLVTEAGLLLRDVATGALTPLMSMEADIPATRSNDARVHPSGTLWFSTMGRNAETGAGAIHAYRLGGVTTLFSGITIPNAICFWPDGGMGYFADTALNHLHRVRLDTRTGLPLETPALLHVHVGEGGLDGAVTDNEGLIWCAMWGAGRLDGYSPEGQLVRSVAVPVRQPSCPVFVGPAFDRLLVTSAWQGMNEDERAADPHHGRTLLVDIGARGRPEPRILLGGA